MDNRLLSALGPDTREQVEPFFRRVRLEQRDILQRPNKEPASTYFPETAIASVVALGRQGRRGEIGLIGYDGCTGISAILGGYRSPHEIFVQVAGTALEVPIADFRTLMESYNGFREVLLAYVQAFLVQVSYTAFSNGQQRLEGRLARWILMSEDRIRGEDIYLTHEFLAVMLGVHRPGVTVAIHVLEGKGLIRASRNRIQVVDREGLEALADGMYGVPEAEYARLIGVADRNVVH